MPTLQESLQKIQEAKNLQNTLNELRNDLQNTKALITARDSEICNLRNIIINKDSQIQSLSKAQSTSNSNDLARIKTLENAVQAKSAEIYKLQQDFANNSQDLDKKRKNSFEKNEKMDLLEKRIKELENIVATQSKDLEDTQNNFKKIEQENNNFKTEIYKKNIFITKLEVEKEILLSRAELAKEQICSKNEIIDTMKDAMANLKTSQENIKMSKFRKKSESLGDLLNDLEDHDKSFSLDMLKTEQSVILKTKNKKYEDMPMPEIKQAQSQYLNDTVLEKNNKIAKEESSIIEIVGEESYFSNLSFEDL